ncbi:BMP family ABC transporter substrate-binding protein [Actinotalea sp.]|uniref:BMP family lipoprotein n=1 Tax=Actinotalea sp. TaxID=1872145 RepID=UPI002B8510A0|nr:BMP family ABC transporter substrate-binding protein [Actinotalea sp.]HQY33081.1 BMP family ABC transporter substrate-binding protein [Actinotalea sp.]HRA51276.1 BMP family ABC transporter substrate-binding protein [Actinotalea sp.]
MKTVMRAAVLATATALVLAACAAAPEEEAEETSAPEETTEETVEYTACMVSDEGGFDDASFNQSGYEGLERAESELGVTIKSAESSDPGQYTANVDSMVQEGCDLIIGVGFALEDAIQAGAEANPDINFALIDSSFSDADFAPVTYDNAKPILFNTHEAAFLAGYLAAGTSVSKTIATYGGMPFPSVTIFMDGFYDGAMKWAEDNGTAVNVLGWDKAAQNGSMIGNFSDTEAGRTTTEQFIASGADVILPVAGPVGAGSLNAASQAEGVSVIWVDSDGFLQAANADYTSLLLTSVMKLIGNSVFDTIAAAVDGGFSSEPYVGTLENGGVDLAPLHDFEATVPAELQATIADLKAQIIAGDLVVESPSQN